MAAGVSHRLWEVSDLAAFLQRRTTNFSRAGRHDLPCFEDLLPGFQFEIIRQRLEMLLVTAVLFIVLAVCYAVWQSNPDSPQPSQSDQGLNINP
jgi:hypothetical protein